MQNGYWNKSIPAGLAAFALGFLLSNAEVYAAAGAVMAGIALWTALMNFKKSSSCLSPAALFSVSWIGGAGISALKLSRLQTRWETRTWICLCGTYVMFMLSYMLLRMFLGRASGSSDPDNDIASVRLSTAYAGSRRNSLQGLSRVQRTGDRQQSRKLRASLLAAIDILTIVSTVALLTEARILGYIPLFTEDTPHAYSYFHISGLHYFTVMSCLVPSFGVLYLMSDGRGRRSELIHVSICMGIAILIPILLVSRFQLIFGIALAVMTGLGAGLIRPSRVINGRSLVLGLSGFLMVLALYVFITAERAHSVEYLNGIFEMRNPATPIWITQPYIYIANNFDNFNCLVRDLKEHTFGLRMLFPLFALTGLKFVFPSLVSFPLYVTKEELTTLTLIYDAYYDFGVAGVLLFALLLGAAAALLEQIVLLNGSRYPVLYVIWSQFCFYLLFSFFTTWYSNPATWFYYGVCVICLLAARLRTGRSRRR